MALSVGTQIGQYEILSLLGKGGMGEVYRGRDLRLKRDVAIKTLPDEFARNEDRLTRFQREAEVLAALNHANIASIYDVQESAGSRFLVLEMVEGDTLADLLARRGALPPDESVGIAKQICQALEAAHDKGITHRDLKPANIKITPEGKVKLLDFGLARMLEPSTPDSALSNSPTFMSRSLPGMIVGTAAYMSPEQARGHAIDRRCDVWALGCVLFEMLTGRPAFAGDTVTDILAQIVTAEPPWSQLPSDIPEGVRKSLRRCLEKDRGRRTRDVGDVALDLDDSGTGAVTAKAGGRRVTVAVALLGWTAALTLFAIWLKAYLEPAAPPNRIEFTVSLPPTSNSYQMVVSPNGKFIAYVAAKADSSSNMLYVRPLGSSTTVALAGTERANAPFWSRDSRLVGFFDNGLLKAVPAEGGPAQTLCTLPRGGTNSGSWGKDYIIVGSANGLMKVPQMGGELLELLHLDTSRHEIVQNAPWFLPDGQHFLYLSWTEQEADRAIFLGSVDSNQTRRLMPSTSTAIYVQGNIVFVREGTVYAQPFDVSNFQLTGDPRTIVGSVSVNGNNGRMALSGSQNGVLAYFSGTALTARQFRWYSRTGADLEPATEPEAIAAANFDLSLDGAKVAASLVSPNGADVWIFDLPRKVKSRFTFDSGRGNPLGGRDVVWSPDGKQLAYTEAHAGIQQIFVKNASGLGEATPLVAANEAAFIEDWSKDGQFIAYIQGTPGGPPNTLYVQRTSGDKTPIAVVPPPFRKDEPHFSYDGKWLAYGSDESGIFEVYVTSLPARDQKEKISNNGGSQPRWRADGKEIYYLTLDGKIMAVDIALERGTLRPGTPHLLFDTGIGVGDPARDQYAVTPDGLRFLILKPVNGVTPLPLTVVANWLPVSKVNGGKPN